MCKQLEISRAAYYKWLKHEIPEAEIENIKLAELIKEYDERFNHILGYRRMTSWINHFNHTNYSKKKNSQNHEKTWDTFGNKKKRRTKYTYSKPDETAENLLQRDFYATAPNQKWATDVTEFKVPGDKKENIFERIIDLYDRYPVAYVISGRMIINQFLKLLIKRLWLILMPSLFFTLIVAFSIPAKHSRKNLKNRK